jgi:2,4-dienoyl-CoA reductase-like NADH-dependent reductase (Old Yellow Enzyme family)/pyruvate/2-oxoglutarate dehydrogenase complex dihydrolipoamide dehydrogenase (E3) component
VTYSRLFSPLVLGPVEARNRIVCGAHFTMFTEPSRTYGEPGFYGERYGRYLAEYARGGVGTVIAGQAQVHPTTAYQMHNNAAVWDPACVPHLRRVSEQIQAHGARAFLQLAHNGGVNHATWSRLPVWSASGVANHMEASKPIELDEIREVIDYFGRSARHAADAGFDGIEVHAAHGYLIHEFLSPEHNHRTDGYGGSFDNRVRFASEVLESVRGSVGAGIAIGVRLVGDEESRSGHGLGPDECAEIAARLARDGLVDFVNVSVGTSGIGMVRPLYAPHLLGVRATAIVKKSVPDVPVFAVHRILTPDEAEGILERGEADAVTLVRALIADPEWANKARAEHAAEIRACTGCNQGCYGNLTQGYPITCVTNPSVGREATLGSGTLTRADTRKRVVVVGGGPAGLEAAWVAAARGHDVTLLERADALGGKIRLAAILPGRSELSAFADWRVDECARRGVDVRLGVDADRSTVLALKPDAVIVATGGHASVVTPSKSHPMPIAGSDQDWVVDHERALLEADSLGARVVVLDAIGHIEAIGIGHYLAERGREVTVVTPLHSPLLLDAETMQKALPRAVRAGVRWRPNTAVVAIGDHEVTVADVMSYAIETLAADHMVIRTHGVANDALYYALQADVPEVVRIGDAVVPRLADRAIYDGHLAARAL